MIDLAIRNALIVDGTGTAGHHGDLGIDGQRIVAVGPDVGAARRTFDVEGRVVAPGFIDVHTHYDAQLSWDPAATPSPEHGVTTVMAGNCGFGLAPLQPTRDADWLKHMMARVEGMPIEALQQGSDWDWTSFSDWLSRFDGNISMNVGVFAGHSTIRRFVMGERSGEQASDADIRKMEQVLRTTLSEGARGFSTSVVWTHHDGDGQPVPSRAATRDEFLRLAAVVREFPNCALELAPQTGAFEEDSQRLFIDMALAADAPLIWNLFQPSPGNPDLWQSQIALSDRARASGAEILALILPQPMDVRMSFISGFAVDAIPGWGDVLRLPIPERIAALADPTVRSNLRHLAETADIPPTSLANVVRRWPSLTVSEVFSAQNKRFLGWTLADVAAELGTDVFDAVLDLVIADELRTGLQPPLKDDDTEAWKLRDELLLDPRTLVGGSDAGAHVDVMCMANVSTKWLRRIGQGLSDISLEAAVRQLTAIPARTLGLQDRGTIAEGAVADFVVFDPDTVGATEPALIADLPGASQRLISHATGVAHVFVGGTELVHDGIISDDTNGQVLRSGT